MRKLFCTAVLMATVALILGGAASATEFPFAKLQKGKSLVDAGDCVACHTQDKSKPFAGGRPIPTPFGIIYSANITPDRDTGIGAWSADDFYRAMHEGIGPHGERLYPAFPYPYFTKMPREDVDAIFAYLSTLKPVQNKTPRKELTWPLDHRDLLAGWDWLFFEPGEFKPDPNKSAEWNRGAYLVEGPGHCGACHTAKNVFGADKKSETLQGANIQDWTAPKLVGDDRNGLGRWNTDDIAEYLKTGRNRFSGATGLMAEVVVNSTSKMSDSDLKAIATYLKSVPSDKEEAESSPTKSAMNAGKAIYADSCAACHQAGGEGVARMFPPLKGDAVAQQADPSTVIRVILEGAMTAGTQKQPTPSAMPAFDWKLKDDQVAAVATYVRNAWGNKASAVSAEDVAKMRKKLAAGKASPETVGTGAKLEPQEQQ
ncbi:MAG TPA: c-type cytochrome [Pseudolabrys sp.]|nr:c-type cytochrome [Pseudolabrys sp.]